ncbi:MAG: alkaline phosphatase, partial [Betaproteobacteria bacterium]
MNRTFVVFFFSFTLVSLANVAVAQSPEEWFHSGHAAVEKAKREIPVVGHARNVILFLGDGMGVATVTAARILEGQQHGMSGEENQLSFEKMPYLALSKTYSANQQTSDSAPTMSAIVTGMKTNDGLISVSERAARGDFRAVATQSVRTILERAEDRGMATGVVTTARLTHATPAACYAHSPDRDWESDADQPDAANEAGFPDIARQLIEFAHGDGLEVALGGGRSKFLPRATHDPEYPDKTGERRDGRDLSQEWLARHPKSAYVWSKAQLDAVDPRHIRHLLGLFQPSHMQYEHDRAEDAAGEPSLTEMTGKALEILSLQPNGYFLMVEGGRIDHAHHAGNAYRALTDTIEFARAVKLAMDRTDSRDTLIIVTADHSHTLTISGYPRRGNPILGKVVEPGHPDEYARDALGLPYTTLGYANGPGYSGKSVTQPEGSKKFPHHGPGYAGITAGRPDLTGVDTTAPEYLQES